MALTQGSPLPNITTTQSQQTTAPSWYTDYLSNLAGQSMTAAGNAQYVGAQPLQQQAFQQAGQNVGTYQPGLTAATNMVTGAGTTTAPGVVNQYMSPYVQNVVEQIGALGQRGIQQNLAPGATAAAVGTGQFGSKRGAEVLGNTIRDALQNINAQQASALNTGYQNALQAAQVDLSRQLGAGQQLGNLAQQTQTQNLADINALATLGAQQQQIGQAEQLFPLQTLSAAAQPLRGYSIPTNVASSYTGPIPGAYSASPLQQIAGLGAIISGASNTNLGAGIGKYINSYLNASSGQAPTSDMGQLINNTAQPGQPGYGWQYYSNGTAIDPQGNYYQNGEFVWSPSLSYDSGSLGGESDLG